MTAVHVQHGLRANRQLDQPHDKLVAGGPGAALVSSRPAAWLAWAMPHRSGVIQKGFKNLPEVHHYQKDVDAHLSNQAMAAAAANTLSFFGGVPATAMAKEKAKARRRQMLAVLLSGAISGSLGATAQATTLPLIDPSDFVIPALAVPDYVSRIEFNFDAAKSAMANLVSVGKYKQASEALMLFPFDVLRQSCFYLPYAVAKYDTEAGERMKLCWLDVKSTGETFDRTMMAAARGNADEEEVIDAFKALWTALEVYRTEAQQLSSDESLRPYIARERQLSR